MIVYLSLLVALIGLLLYLLLSHPKGSECGRLMFFAGLLSFLLKTGEPLINLFGGR